MELDLGGKPVILDAGTGIRGLGRQLLEHDIRTSTLLLTHVHWDHTNGFPFFQPVFSEACSMQIMAGGLQAIGGVREALAGQMAAPNFPVPLDALHAHLEFQDFLPGDKFALSAEIKVKTATLNHPDGATGYRVEFGGKALCYVTDTEHVPGQPDENVLSLIEGADLVIYDATYTDAELPAHVGWGHSTWQEGVRLCRQASVKQLAIFHHDPDHDDPFMDQLEADARQVWGDAFVAREGLCLEL
ncbi:MAG: MBL fold metallo-hydrolase [Myxococcales bacterium]|nr:MBL fold metallo-hydrolase [Myxococcales bacterium]